MRIGKHGQGLYAQSTCAHAPVYASQCIAMPLCSQVYFLKASALNNQNRLLSADLKFPNPTLLKDRTALSMASKNHSNFLLLVPAECYIKLKDDIQSNHGKSSQEIQNVPKSSLLGGGQGG